MGDVAHAVDQYRDLRLGSRHGGHCGFAGGVEHDALEPLDYVHVLNEFARDAAGNAAVVPWVAMDASTLDFGGVLVNEVPTWRADQQPYGGLRDSGNTREGPAFSVKEMTEIRMVVLS